MSDDADAADGDTANAAGAVDALTALLHIPADAAQRIRALTPTRPRPRPQSGPSADYGQPDP